MSPSKKRARATCALCRSEATLRESHVLPEFVYRPAYDENHGLIDYDRQARRQRVRRKGFWETLLCDACEGRFGRLENYFARTWFSKSVRPSLAGKTQVTVRGLDYAQFKLFHLSILWRAGVAKSEPFRSVSLGPHEERLRLALLADDPGPPEKYPIAGLALRDPETGGFRDDILHLPTKGRLKGYHFYVTHFGGVSWFYGISGHSGLIPAALRDNGSLGLRVQDWLANRMIQDLARDLQAGLS